MFDHNAMQTTAYDPDGHKKRIEYDVNGRVTRVSSTSTVRN